jgi:hypothetical protein
MHFPSSASVMSAIAAMATLATCLPTDATPAHQLVQRDGPKCGFAFAKGYSENTRDVLGDGTDCKKLSDLDAESLEFSVVFTEPKCQWCDTFS